MICKNPGGGYTLPLFHSRGGNGLPPPPFETAYGFWLGSLENRKREIGEVRMTTEKGSRFNRSLKIGKVEEVYNPFCIPFLSSSFIE